MIKYLSLFSGIGAFEKALQRLEIPYELVGYCEIDKYASKAYSLLHNVPESMNYGDITKIDENSLPKDIDLITYGFPCQDISLAGKQQGFEDAEGNKTRSGLFFDALRIIRKCQPKIAIAENVKNLTGKKFSEQFNIVLNSLGGAGYDNYWKVLNAKNYEIPQNRERVFIISIRKDIDTEIFEFPDGVSLQKCLKDLLEKSVDEKYFVNPEKCRALSPELVKEMLEKKLSNTVRGGGRGSFDKHQWDLVAIRKEKTEYGWHFEQQVYDENGITRALKAGGGSGNIPKVIVHESIKNFWFPVEIDGKVEYVAIRKLTPKECFRLMGFDDSDVDLLAENGISNTQLYKMAGNSIVVNVLEFLFCQIFDSDNEIWV